MGRTRASTAAPFPGRDRPNERGTPQRDTVLVLWVGHRPGRVVCRSLERGGFRVVRAHPADEPGGGLRGHADPLRYPPPADDPDGFVDFLAHACVREHVSAVLPFDEDIVRLLAERAPELGGAVVVGPDAHQYRTLCDKAALAEAAARAGIDHPTTVVVRDRSQGRPGAPCLVKPSISGSSGLWAQPRLALTASDRDAAVDDLLAAGIPALVQERIDGPRWVVHCVRSERSFDFRGFRVDRDFPRGDGPASVLHIARVPDEVRAATERLLASAGYRGPCSLSFIERDGRFFLHDVNLRLGRVVEASVRSGFEIPARAVNAVLGRSDSPLPPAEPVMYVRLDAEMRQLVRDLRNGRGTSDGLGLAVRIGAGLVTGRTVLDPSPLGPGWVGRKLAREGRRTIDRLRQRR